MASADICLGHDLPSRVRLIVSVLLIASVCVPFLSQSIVSGQYITITTTVTSQVYSQPFDMSGTHLNGDTRECSIQYFPDSGVRLSKGDEITGTLTATAPLYLAIVTTGYTIHYGPGGCAALLGSQLYSTSYYSGAPVPFQWTATFSCVCYVALLNGGPNEIQGSLTINQVTVTEQQQYTQVNTPNTPSSYTTPYTPYYTYSSTPSAVTSTPSLQLPQPPQTTGSTGNMLQLGLVIAVIAAVALVALLLYSRRGRQPRTTKIKKVDSRTKKVASGKNFCIECGTELPLKAKFCNRCGSKQP